MPPTAPEQQGRPHPARFIDHTLLAPTATGAGVTALCEEAVEHAFAAVCIPPRYVSLAAECLYGSEVGVATVVGFPCGYNCLRQKVQETVELVAAGATEIDMVVTLAHLLEGRFDLLEEEIAQVVIAAQQAPVKVIIECCYLDRAQKIAATQAAVAAGAAFVKTSTGFGPSGATLEDVQLLVDAAAGQIAVKAAGGIRSWQACEKFLAAGAERIGTSSGVAILQQWQLAG